MVILDASAILAYLHNEPGWQTVEPGILNAIAHASPVNIAEVASKLIDRGVPPDDALSSIAILKLTVLPFAAQETAIATRFKHREHRATEHTGNTRWAGRRVSPQCNPVPSQREANAVQPPRHSGLDPESSVCKHLDTGLRRCDGPPP
ncbi:MAG: hypothetical protein IPI44_17410 [Sulfuritalea sp.]|nr:hypothetical protein [Sulfuritalea sp.]